MTSPVEKTRWRVVGVRALIILAVAVPVSLVADRSGKPHGPANYFAGCLVVLFFYGCWGAIVAASRAAWRSWRRRSDFIDTGRVSSLADSHSGTAARNPEAREWSPAGAASPLPPRSWWRPRSRQERIDAEIARYLAEPLNRYSPQDVLPRRDERFYLEQPAQLTRLENATTFVGGSRGASFRVAKGVTLRGSSSRGTPVQTKRMAPKVQGKAYLSDRRILFVSGVGAEELPLDQISAYKVYGDGLRVDVSGAAAWILKTGDTRFGVSFVRVARGATGDPTVDSARTESINLESDMQSP